MNSFLKKLGTILVNVASTAVGIGPIIAPLLGSKAGAVATGVATVSNDLTAIASVIVQIETVSASLTGLTGAQKLQAATVLIKPIISTSELVSGKKIANEALFNQSITEITQGIVDLLNSIDQSAASSEIKTS